MRKDIMGEWGSHLDDGDYACALAALGVLESMNFRYRETVDVPSLIQALKNEFSDGERTLLWRATSLGVTNQIYWRESGNANAETLAAAWRGYAHYVHHGRERPRIAVSLRSRERPDLFDVEALYAWLNHPEVNLGTLILAGPNGMHRRPLWHWPVRVGVPVGTEHAAILAALNAARDARWWVERLSHCYALGSGRDSCDLLLLTSGGMRQILDQPRTRIRASFVVCLETPLAQLSEVGDSHFALLDKVQAAGLALIGRPDQPQQVGEWHTELVRHLSHDVPVHGAVYRTGRVNFGRDNPMLLGDPGALDSCRILALAERQDRLIAALGRRPILPDGTPSISLADSIRTRAFTAETTDGNRAADELARGQDDIERALAPRWVQVTTWGNDGRAGVRALAPEQWNLLGVHIGPTAEERSDAPFPDRRIASGRDNVVAIQLELAGARIAPVPQHLRRVWDLPVDWRLYPETKAAEQEDSSTVVGLASSELRLPAVGDSEHAFFAVHPNPSASQVLGRVAIIHNNRVLQTANLLIEVSADTSGGRGPLVTAESAIHPRDDDLDERRDYDVAIQVSNIGDELHLTVQRDQVVTQVQLADLLGPIARMRTALTQAAKNWDYSLPLNQQPVFPDTLYTLAAAGSELEQHLRKRCGNGVDHWERVHLVPFTNKFLPLEYVYDGPPPTIDARVCPNILGALDRGDCEQAVDASGVTTPCPHQKDKAFLCPMHFWGFHRVIERSATVDHPAPSAASGSPPPNVCVPSRLAYGRIQSLLFAATQRAFAYVKPDAQANERAMLVAGLSMLFPAVLEADDWAEWRAEVTKKPNLLILVPHTDTKRGSPVLEIGNGKLLGRQEIGPDLSGADGQPQILLLLGCAAADVTEDFHPYPERFRDAGVSIVLAPLAPIRGADAIPMTRHIAKTLAESLAGPEPIGFGELMPGLRRKLLKEGLPAVMGLVGFGDGDWLLGGP